LAWRVAVPESADLFRSAEALWNAIDLLAVENGLTPSALARQAGLDPTALNPSKRRRADGSFRWLSLETLVRILESLGHSPASFLLGQERGPSREPSRLRLVMWSELGENQFFDRAGLLAGPARDFVTHPIFVAGPHDYAVRLDTDFFEPVFRAGALLLVSPGAIVGVGDRVLGVRKGKFFIGTVNSVHGRMLDIIRAGDGEKISGMDLAHRILAGTL
jgi:phage repressor protein C with HTH and peptisase S24 domain